MAAAPKMVVLPPPLGPTRAVTGKSNVTSRSVKPRTLLRMTRRRYWRYAPRLTRSSSACSWLSRIPLRYFRARLAVTDDGESAGAGEPEGVGEPSGDDGVSLSVTAEPPQAWAARPARGSAPPGGAGPAGPRT